MQAGPHHATGVNPKWRILGAAIALLAATVIQQGSAHAAEELVDIPDPGFAACLKAALGALPLTEENLASLNRTSLICNQGPPIEDLTGAQFLTSLRGLDLTSNAVSDLSPLRQATALRSLRLGGNPVSSVEPLRELPQLLHLDVVGLEADLGILADFPSLKALDVGASEAAGYGFLSGLPRPVILTIDDDSLTSLADIALPPTILSLNLKTPALTSFAGLESQVALTSFRQAESKVTDLTPLAGLPALRYLGLDHSAATDLTPLRGLTGLTDLGLPGSRATDLSPLAGLTNLTWLDLSEGTVSDLTALTGMSSLQRLWLDLNRIADLEPLAGLTDLTQLNLADNRIADLGPLSELRALQELRLDDNQISDLGPLAGLTGLSQLSLARNEISDISALAGLPDGATLMLWGNDVRDFSPLRDWEGSLFATHQYSEVSGIFPNQPVGFEVRGRDGDLLTPTQSPDETCSYSAGTLTCTHSGSHYLYFTEGSSIGISVRVEVESRRLTLVTPPSTGGSLQVPAGTTLTARPGNWSPAPERFTYRWLGNNSLPIPGATSSTYQVDGTEGGSVGIEVTAHRRGYDPTTEIGTYVLVTTGTLANAPTPSVGHGGRVATDTVLTARAGSWDSGVTLAYQWQRDRRDIAGAVSPTYRVSASDVGHRLRVRVRGSKPGYDAATRYSREVAPAKAKFSAPSGPKVGGRRAVGETLRAKVDWTPQATLTYRWYRNGKAIKGATRSSYTLKPGDLGDRFKVRVTATRSGYSTVSRTSPSTDKVARGRLAAPPAGIGGTPVVGSRLTAYHGSWRPGGVRFTYQWLRDGKAIEAATAKSYRVTARDAGHRLTVRITGRKAAYSPATTSSTVTVR